MQIPLVSRAQLLMGLTVMLLAGCASKVPLTTPQPPPTTQAQAPVAPSAQPALPPTGQTQPGATPPKAPAAPKVSVADNARAYRKDAAAHLYDRNQHRIYKGTMPPLLYAIGVLNVEIDRRGNVVSTTWQRAPRHAPEVMAEIIRSVEAAAPFPLPSKLGRITYTDTWLWDESGQFQLDTLTEGQR